MIARKLLLSTAQCISDEQEHQIVKYAASKTNNFNQKVKGTVVCRLQQAASFWMSFRVTKQCSASVIKHDASRLIPDLRNQALP